MQIMRKFRFLLFIVLIPCFMMLTLASWAQRLPYAEASVDEIEPNKIFAVSFTYRGLDARFEKPKFGDIELREKIGNSTNITGFNANDATITVVYAAVVKTKGYHQLGPARITYPDGTVKHSNTVRVRGTYNPSSGTGMTRSAPSPGTQVITRPRRSAPQSGSSRPNYSINPDELIFLKSTADKTTAYIGEPITVTTKLYYKVNFQTEPMQTVPKHNGFWAEHIDVGDPTQNIYTEYYNGQQYNVMVVSKEVLYPIQPGELKVTPLQLEGIAKIPTGNSRRRSILDEFFDDPFLNNHGLGQGAARIRQLLEESESMFEVHSRNVPISLNSGVLKITAKSVPKDAQGQIPAIGRYSMEARVTQHKISTDDIDTLIVTIRGEGNPEFIKAPKVNSRDLDFFSTYEEDSITSQYPMRGYKKIYYTFMPNSSGYTEVPSLRISYFDPTSEQLTETTTAPIALEVSQGEILSQKESIARSIPRPIHQISQLRDTDYWISKPTTWAALSTPLLAYLMIGFYTRQKEKARRDPVQYRRRKADKIAHERLQTAQQYMLSGEADLFYTEINKALWLYVSDKSAIPLSQISRDSVSQWLQEQQISEQTMRDFIQTTEDAERHLYAGDPGSHKMQEEYARAVDVIANLESQLS